MRLTVRGPSEDELAEAREKGVEFERVPIARGALVFMVHADNSVPSLTRDEPRAIFSLATMMLIRWLQPDEGQAVVQESGYVKLPPG